MLTQSSVCSYHSIGRQPFPANQSSHQLCLLFFLLANISKGAVPTLPGFSQLLVVNSEVQSFFRRPSGQLCTQRHMKAAVSSSLVALHRSLYNSFLTHPSSSVFCTTHSVKTSGITAADFATSVRTTAATSFQKMLSTQWARAALPAPVTSTR